MNRIEQTYNLNIYTWKAIETAAGYYDSLCKVTMKKRGESCVCTFEAQPEYIRQIVYEFGNFLIELMQRREYR